MMDDAFARAYKEGQWHHGSGSGSSPGNTREYRRFLQDYLRDNSIGSVLDAGCGDWQFSRLIDWTGITYLGVDLVPGVILANSVRYGLYGYSTIRFACGDILGPEPVPDADLVIVKDLLQHWPDQAVHDLGAKLDGRRALLTYDLGKDFTGEQIAPGGYRPLDLTAAPFAWPVRERLRYESVSHEGTKRRTKVVMELAP